MIEFRIYEEALQAKENLNESNLLDKQINVEWAFIQKPIKFEFSAIHNRM